jgi:hypothetical protein
MADKPKRLRCAWWVRNARTTMRPDGDVREAAAAAEEAEMAPLD